jgi:hypothetical protein
MPARPAVNPGLAEVWTRGRHRQPVSRPVRLVGRARRWHTPMPPFQLDELKLHPPPRPGIVSRTALVDRLARTHERIVSITAPARYGKTTTLGLWAQQKRPGAPRPQPCGSTDESAAPGHGRRTSRARFHRGPAGHRLARADRRAGLPVTGPTVPCSTSGAADLAMDAQDGPSLLAGATRRALRDWNSCPREPNRRLARLGSTWRHWRSTPGVPRSTWAAGSPETTGTWATTFDPSSAVASRRADVTFLRRTSILDRLSGPLCDATVGRKGSAAVLERLERRNLQQVGLVAFT